MTLRSWWTGAKKEYEPPISGAEGNTSTDMEYAPSFRGAGQTTLSRPLERRPSAKVLPSFLHRIQGSCVSLTAAPVGEDGAVRGSHETVRLRRTEAPGSTDGGKVETESIMGRLCPTKIFMAFFWRTAPSEPEMDAEST
jgi:hypothetical protein